MSHEGTGGAQSQPFSRTGEQQVELRGGVGRAGASSARCPKPGPPLELLPHHLRRFFCSLRF